VATALQAKPRQSRSVFRNCATLLVCATLWVVAAQAQLKYTDTSELRIVYHDPAVSFLVPSATHSFLDALEAQTKLFGYRPDGKVNLLLQDFSDVSNATAVATPWNRIFFEVSQPDEPYDSMSSAEYFPSVAAHETTHLVVNDSANAADLYFRRLFRGKVDVDAQHPESLLYYYLTTPRSTAPRWYQEGSAVFMETWRMGGTGRAQGGYDEMVFRSMVSEAIPFYDPLSLVSKGTEVDFRSGANAYLYGTRFMNYMALTYSPEQLLSWWHRAEGTKRYYADDFQRAFGLPLNQAWSNWVRFEQDFQQRNLVSVQAHRLTSYQDVTKQLLGSVSRIFLSADGNQFYAAVQYPGQVSHLVSIARKDGLVKSLHDIRGPGGLRVSSLAYDAARETLFFTTNNNTYRNIEALDLRSGKVRMLYKAARIGDLAFNATDRSLWGLRHNRGMVMLVRMPYPYTDFKVTSVFQFAEQVVDLDISADGQWLALSVTQRGSKPTSAPLTEVRVISTEAAAVGDMSPAHRFQLDGAAVEDFVFSPDGQYLFGSSYYTGVSNIYRYELKTEELEAVSNTAVGFFKPLPLSNDRLLVQRFSGLGFVPTLIAATPTDDLSAITLLGHQVAARHPVVNTWGLPSPSAASAYDARITARGDYSPLRQLRLNSIIPGIAGYKGAKAFGLSAVFTDPVGLDALKADLSYSSGGTLPARQRLHASVDLHAGDWVVGGKWNGADFYDLFGPTKRALEGYSVYANYDRPLVFDPPQTLDFVAKFAFYGGLNSLPGFQNVLSPSRNLSLISAGFVSVDTLLSPGAVDAEAGHTWSLMAHTYGVAGALIPSLTARYDVGFALPLDHSSVWLRSGVSVSEGSVRNPLANVYLGGFGNNYVDNAANGGAQRYRDLLSMPGFGLDSLTGKTLAKAQLEWSAPPIRFDAMGSPGFYLSWLRPEIFASFLETDLQNQRLRSSAENVGVQLDFQLQVMHRLPMMFSMGFARGFGGAGRGKDEFMLSFQVL